jgi:hypothetical protein
MEGFWLIDSSCSQHMTRDRRWFSSLTPVMTKEHITFGDNGKGRVLSVGTVKVSESVTLQRVSLVKSLGYCDNPPRKIPYYRLNQSTLVIKQ